MGGGGVAAHIPRYKLPIHGYITHNLPVPNYNILHAGRSADRPAECLPTFSAAGYLLQRRGWEGVIERSDSIHNT